MDYFQMGGKPLNPSYFIILFFLFVVIFSQRQKKYTVLMHIRRRGKNREGGLVMETLAKQFIGKEVLIYTISDSFGGNIQGVVRTVENGGMILDVKGELQAVNLEYVIRIREYPKNSKGKKKSVVVD